MRPVASRSFPFLSPSLPLLLPFLLPFFCLCAHLFVGVLGIVVAEANLLCFVEKEIINISCDSRVALILCGGSGLIPKAP